MKRFTKEELSWLEEHFPNTPDSVLAETLGASVYTIRARRQHHGWRKSPEFISNQRREIALKNGSSRNLNTPEAIAKRAAKWNDLHKEDKLRIKWGLLPVTKRHYRIEPREKLLQRNRLERLGYIVDKFNNIAYYTPTTKRAVRIEKIPRGTKKGTIRSYYDFKPYEDGNMD